MAVEGVEGAGGIQEEMWENGKEEVAEWNARLVEYPTALTRVEQFVERYRLAQSEVQCCSGSAGISASTDTQGNTEIEASVELENEGGEVTVEVSGSVTRDGEGNTSGKVEGGVKVKW
ncbi:MAG: hypothetical protein KDK76_05755 [Chlamydiia bacterium]|nr:hypothetical protein [Chlamydiia bacterium]